MKIMKSHQKHSVLSHWKYPVKHCHKQLGSNICLYGGYANYDHLKQLFVLITAAAFVTCINIARRRSIIFGGYVDIRATTTITIPTTTSVHTVFINLIAFLSNQQTDSNFRLTISFFCIIIITIYTTTPSIGTNRINNLVTFTSILTNLMCITITAVSVKWIRFIYNRYW